MTYSLKLGKLTENEGEGKYLVSAALPKKPVKVQ